MLGGQEGRQETHAGCCQPLGDTQDLALTQSTAEREEPGESGGIWEVYLSEIPVCWPQGRGKGGQGMGVRA